MSWLLDYREDAFHALLLALVGIFAAWCGLSRRHWFWRLGAAMGIAWLLFPTEAYEPIIFYLLVVVQVTVALVIIRVVGDRRSGSRLDPSPSHFTFNLKELLLATSLAGVGMGIAALLAMQKLENVPRVVASSVAAAILSLAACFLVATSARLLLKAIVAVTVVAAATAIWHYSFWIDRQTLLLMSMSPTMGFGQDLLAKNLAAAAAVLLIVTAGIAAIHAGQLGVSRRWLLWSARGITLLVVMIALPVGAYLYFRLSVYEKPPAVELPNPNAYGVLLRAGNTLLNVNIPRADTDPPDAFSQFVKKHEAALDTARDGLALPCRVPWSYTADDLTNMANACTAVLQLARGFYAEAKAHAQAGDYPAAAGSGVDAVHLSANYPRGGMLVDLLVGNALGAFGMKALKEIRPRLDAATCRSTAKQLAEIERSRDPFGEICHRDRIWGQNALGWRGRLELAQSDLLYGEYSETEQIRAAEARQTAVLRLLIAELAVQAYRLDQESAPASLDQLVPDYLAEVPLDPYSGAPLRYRAGGPQPMVYSVGPDGDDDGGRALDREGMTGGEDGDVVLDYPEEED